MICGGFMAIYTIGDLHLSLDADKAMDVFPGWENYVQRIRENWLEQIRDEDTVVLVGDHSWGMGLAGARRDLAFIDALPGHKLLVKGNHDYWWSTRAKMEAFFEREGFSTLEILHNSAQAVQGVVLCGSRGWLFEKGEPHDRKIILREAARLEASLAAGAKFPGEKIAFLHYPPLFADQELPEIIDVLCRYQVRRCYYGHIHSASCACAFNGEYRGILFRLVSADFLRFRPLPIPISGAETGISVNEP